MKAQITYIQNRNHKSFWSYKCRLVLVDAVETIFLLPSSTLDTWEVDGASGLACENTNKHRISPLCKTILL